MLTLVSFINLFYIVPKIILYQQHYTKMSAYNIKCKKIYYVVQKEDKVVWLLHSYFRLSAGLVE